MFGDFEKEEFLRAGEGEERGEWGRSEVRDLSDFDPWTVLLRLVQFLAGVAVGGDGDGGCDVGVLELGEVLGDVALAGLDFDGYDFVAAFGVVINPPVHWDVVFFVDDLRC